MVASGLIFTGRFGRRHSRFLQIPLITLALGLCSCTTVTVTAPDGTRHTRSIEEFEKYVEQVFKHQNRVMLESGSLQEELQDPDALRRLEHMEKQVLEACEAVNQAAILQSREEDIDLLLQLEVRDTIAECDHATGQMEQLINAL